jgi:hypothetical protein
MAANGLGIILFRYADWLHAKGYSRNTIHLYTQAVEHFGFWRAKHHPGSQNVQPSEVAEFLQRARWEGGKFRMAREQSLGLLGDVLSGRLRSLEPLMDLLLLPLAFHVMLLVLAAFAPWTPARLAGFGGLLIVLVHLIVLPATKDPGPRLPGLSPTWIG